MSFFFFYFYVWVILHLIYSIHILYIGKAKKWEKERQVFLFLQFFVCHSRLGILSKSSNSILKNGLLLKRVCFFFAYFLLTNFYYYYFYSSVYFIFKEKEMSLNDYIFLFCLFFHLPPKKSNSDCHLFCVSLMQNKWETWVARLNDVLLLWSVPHVVKKLKISFRWKKNCLQFCSFSFPCFTRTAQLSRRLFAFLSSLCPADLCVILCYCVTFFLPHDLHFSFPTILLQ